MISALTHICLGGYGVNVPFMQPRLNGSLQHCWWNAMPLMVEARRHASAKPDSSLTGIISITIRVRRAFRNVMKPWFECVLTP